MEAFINSFAYLVLGYITLFVVSIFFFIMGH